MISSASIQCSCKALGELVSVGLEGASYAHVGSKSYGTYTDYNGYVYWEKSFGFVFCMGIIGVYLVLYPIFYFGERKKLNRIRLNIKRELQQLDPPAFKELDNEFKSVVALEQSRDSNLGDFDQTADERSREKMIRNKNIIPSSGLKRLQNKQKVLPHVGDFEEDKPSKYPKTESQISDFDTASMPGRKARGVLREEDADKSSYSPQNASMDDDLPTKEI